nr:DUF1778 domain-containing protein [Mesorhizobium sp. AR07]
MTPDDEASAALVVVIGQTIATQLFGESQLPVGAPIQLKEGKAKGFILYGFNPYYIIGPKEIPMPRNVSDNGRIDFRIPPEAKAVIARAAALSNVGLTEFVTRSALRDAQAAIERAEHLALSERDSLRVLDLLENPPAPTDRLIRAAKAGQTLA